MSPPDPQDRRYEHRFHAGNPGDVLKHLALVALLDSTPAPRRVVESHAGAGRYALGPTGEHTAGIGRMQPAAEDADGPPPQLVLRYLEQVARLGGRSGYPGSPLHAADLLGADGKMILHELEPATCAELRRALGGDPRAEVRLAEGLAALPEAVAELGGRGLVLVDPPYADKREWNDVPRALAAVARACPQAELLLWYPIVSYTRPNALLSRLREDGVAGTAIELLSSPLDMKKHRLNGSGVFIGHATEARAPVLDALATAAAWAGRRLATRDAAWVVRRVSFGASLRPRTKES